MGRQMRPRPAFDERQVRLADALLQLGVDGANHFALASSRGRARGGGLPCGGARGASRLGSLQIEIMHITIRNINCQPVPLRRLRLALLLSSQPRGTIRHGRDLRAIHRADSVLRDRPRSAGGWCGRHRPRIGALIAARTDAELRWTPSADRWSIAQILAHLADVEIVSGYRMRMILSAPARPFRRSTRTVGTCAATTRTAMRLPRSRSSDAPSVVGRATRVARRRGARSVRHACRTRARRAIRYLMRLNSGHDLNHLRRSSGCSPIRSASRPPIAPVRPARDQARPARSSRCSTSTFASGRSFGRVTSAGTDRLASVDRGLRGSISERLWLASARSGLVASALVGQQALFVVNLPAKTIRGQLSEGMLFDLGYEDGMRPALAQPEWPMPDGRQGSGRSAEATGARFTRPEASPLASASTSAHGDAIEVARDRLLQRAGSDGEAKRLLGWSCPSIIA